MLKLIQQVNSLMNKLIKRLNKGEEKMKKKKMMSVIVAMMLVVGMLGCSKCKLRSNGMPVPLLRNCYSIFNGTKYR